MAFVLKDLKANESRLKDINKVAEDLESEGLMAEEVQAVQQQVGIWVLVELCGHKEAACSFLCSHNPASQGVGHVLCVTWIIFFNFCGPVSFTFMWQGKAAHLILISIKYRESCWLFL